MMRVVAAALVLITLASPLGVYPAPPVTWLLLVALLVGAAGVVLLSVALVTACAALALIAQAMALMIVRPPIDPLAAAILGVTLTLLPLVVHFTARAEGAFLGPGVLAAQIRTWLMAAGAGVAAAAALTAAASGLASAFLNAPLPLVVAAGALGAALTVAGAVALLAGRGESAPRR
ncbi:MAG TPA: hypothetical protein VFW70_06980 [Methylomirabilota bacterium]|nr:hypothetical protein [Methylomirabilota bacterium]